MNHVSVNLSSVPKPISNGTKTSNTVSHDAKSRTIQGEEGEVYQERLVEVNKEELLRLVNLQRERLQTQEMQLHVLDVGE